jgi:hypothetical protein
LQAEKEAEEERVRAAEAARLRAEEDAVVQLAAERFPQGNSTAARVQLVVNLSEEIVESTFPAECAPKVLRRHRTSRGPRTSSGSERR